MNETQVTFVRHLLDQYPHWFEETGRMDLAQMSNRNYPYSMLFSPIQINRLTLKNRIVMGPVAKIPLHSTAPRQPSIHQHLTPGNRACSQPKEDVL